METASSVCSESVKGFLETVDENDKETVEILRQTSRSKPYHAIMRIILFVWPMDRRRLVCKELRQLRDLKFQEKYQNSLPVEEISPYTQLIWKDLNVEPYYAYINRHKRYVTVGYEHFNSLVVSSVKHRLYDEKLLLDEYDPKDDTDDHQIAVHDNSKYSFVETVTYAMKWYPCKGLESFCDDDAWETGLEHHYCHNEHHPEYWGEQPMKWRYIVESMYDMAAMELEKKFKGQEPENKAALLVFDPKYLTRFSKTGQLDLLEKLCQYTIEAYCKSTGHPLPSKDPSMLK